MSGAPANGAPPELSGDGVDGALVDGARDDSALVYGATNDGATNDGATNDGATNDGATDHSGEPVLRIDRVGPGGGVPSDNAFGVAFVSLWQRVVEGGGQVGFGVPVVRSEVAARAAGLVDEIRTGRVIAVAANRSHRLIGAALLRPGRGSAEYTGHVELILVDPAHSRTGIGSQLLPELIRLARERGLTRLDLDAADDGGPAAFFTRFGFEQWGRRPGWIRAGHDENHDEIVWGVTL